MRTNLIVTHNQNLPVFYKYIVLWSSRFGTDRNQPNPKPENYKYIIGFKYLRLQGSESVENQFGTDSKTRMSVRKNIFLKNEIGKKKRRNKWDVVELGFILGKSANSYINRGSRSRSVHTFDTDAKTYINWRFFLKFHTSIHTFRLIHTLTLLPLVKL